MQPRKKTVISLPTLGRDERHLLSRLIGGQTKLRRFPSQQWSVSGKRFIKSSIPERLLRLGLIEQHDISSKGVSIYAPTQRARTLRDLADARPGRTAAVLEGGSETLKAGLPEVAAILEYQSPEAIEAVGRR